MYAGACDVIHIAEPVLGGARTLGKLDESSTGARLSAQMRGRVTRKNSAGVRLIQCRLAQ